MKVSPASNERLSVLLRTYWETVLALGSGERSADRAVADLPPPPRPPLEADASRPS